MLSEINQRVFNVAKYSRPNFVFIGLIGVTLFPLYYYIFVYLFPQNYENIPLRIVGVMLFIPLTLFNFLPDFYKKHFHWHLFIACFYAIFFCNFMWMKNDLSNIWSITYLGTLFIFIIITYDWIIALITIVICTLLAYLLVFTIPKAPFPENIQTEHLPIYFLVFLCGAILRYKNKASDVALLSLLKDLSGSIAHEMRGPLGSINQSISMINDRVEKLKRNLPSNFPAQEINEIKELVTMVERSINRGNMTIDMILKNIQEKKIDSDDFKVILMSDVIKVVMKEYAFGPGEKEIVNINYANDFHFKGDENLMVFTLFNLIKNSLYYMKMIANGRIDIWMEAGDQTNALHFKDNGPGIAKERLSNMFENYKTQGKKGGTGLGLPFCKRAMISFNGEIECHSEFGEWTEFIMIFPICLEAPSIDENQEEISVSEVENLTKGKTILLVDDDNLIRMVMKARLKDFDVTIIEARQGKEAIEYLEQKPIDLVFMDIQMPEIDGMQTTKEIRSGTHFKNFQNYKNIPIIALTGNSEDDKRLMIKESGMSDCLDKSMTKEELFKTLAKWFSPQTPNNS